MKQRSARLTSHPFNWSMKWRGGEPTTNDEHVLLSFTFTQLCYFLIVRFEEQSLSSARQTTENLFLWTDVISDRGVETTAFSVFFSSADVGYRTSVSIALTCHPFRINKEPDFIDSIRTFIRTIDWNKKTSSTDSWGDLVIVQWREIHVRFRLNEEPLTRPFPLMSSRCASEWR